MQLVRGDGRIANLYRDWPKWDAVCQAAEQRGNLARTRGAGAGQRPLSRAEMERAHHTQREPARRELAHRVRAAAVAVITESAFPTELRRSGVLVEPRLSAARVVGYRVALPTDDGVEPLWLSGSQLARDLSLPKLRARWEERGAHWDRFITRAWQRASESRPGPEHQDQHDFPNWELARRLLADATEDIKLLGRDQADRWTQDVGHTADLVAALSQRLEPEPGLLYHAGQHLARAAQPDRPRPPVQPGLGRPILLEVARLVARSGDPAQAATIAAVVLLVYGLVRLLDHLATRHTSDHAQRRQLQLAGMRLAQHPSVANYPTTRPTRQTPAPSRPPIAEVDHLRRARRVGPPGHHGRGR